MDQDEHLRYVYEQMLRALEEAIPRLVRHPAEAPDIGRAQRSGLFHLGVAGGLAFFGHLPGMKAEALFDEVSDAAEKRDWHEVGRIRKEVAARLRPGHVPDASSTGEDGLDWASGYPQLLAVFREARAAREQGDAPRWSLMMGFLVGLMSGMPRYGPRYRHGFVKEAIVAAYDEDPESARTWVKVEEITPWADYGESADTDPRDLLLRWVQFRLAAGDRFTCPTFFFRESAARQYYDQQEASTQRAQNFGKRLADPDTEGVWVSMSHALNRALVLGSDEE